ncbi:conserved membrane hypothetical protein [Burkholderiales bacterium]|nr:conserved membrane hypothetical protein [Burkholderiales bacterium]
MDAPPAATPRILNRCASDLNVEIDPAIIRLYLLYVVPLSPIPAAMMLYAWDMYHATLLPSAPFGQASTMAFILFLSELVAVPVMASVIQTLGTASGIRRAYKDAFAVSAVAPTLLWLAPLLLFVPSLAPWGITGAVVATALLLHLGTYSAFQLEEEDRSRRLAWSIIAAGLCGWMALILTALLAWGIIAA